MGDFVMHAVWSYWTKPAKENNWQPWLEEKYHLFSWILSVSRGSAHYPDTELVTDSAGAKYLVDKLGLEFKTVSVVLDSYADINPGWWMAGKLVAYGIQQKPFIHIDADAYLWKRLSPEIEKAPVIAQNPEDFRYCSNWYFCDKFRIINESGGWIPEEGKWYIRQPVAQRGECCGIFGGCAVDFIRLYSDKAIKTMRYPDNIAIWESIGHDPVLMEQYFLAACIEYHKAIHNGQFNNLYIKYLLNDIVESEDTEKGAYTHLMSGAKKDPFVLERLEKRVQNDYPDFYNRVMNICS